MDLQDPVTKFRLEKLNKISKVTVYSKENCIQCLMVKMFFDQNKVPYDVIDTTGNTELIEKIQSYGYSGLPLIVLNENFKDAYVGYHPDALDMIAKEVLKCD